MGEMKKGERALVTVAKVALAAEEQLGLKDVTAQSVVFTIELVDFEKAKDTWSMSEEEKVEFGVERKEMGTALFKRGRLELALQRYKKVGETFQHIDNFKEENKAKAKELKNVCELNKAACFLKLQDYTEARSACNNVLKESANNVKALYRRAQAEFGLKNFQECIRDCKSMVQADPQNKEARQLLKDAQTGQKEVDKQSKGLFTNMCKALGKGPIPAPGKTKLPLEHEEDEEEEEIKKEEGKISANAESAVDNATDNVEAGTEVVNGESNSADKVNSEAK